MIVRHRVTFRSLMCGVLALIGLGTVAISLTVWTLRNDIVEDVYADTRNIAGILAEQTARAVQVIDAIATDVEEQFSTLAPVDEAAYIDTLRSEETWNNLVLTLARLPQADTLILIDRHGRIANTATTWPSPLTDLSDRDYFQHHSKTVSSDLYISSVLRNRLNGGRTVFMSKRLHGHDNTFLGVVLIGVRHSYFQHILDSVTATRNLTFLFARTDGKVLLRHPTLDSAQSFTIPEGSPWLELVRAGGGHFRSPGYLDDVPRMVSVKTLRHFPLAINVAISEEEALAPWRQRALLIGLGAAMAVLCSLLLLWALNRQYRLVIRSEESLAEREMRLAERTDELKTVNHRLDSALNNMMLGLAMFNANTRLVICNECYLEMYGLSRDIVREGCALRAILEHRRDTGTFFGDIGDYIGSVARMLRTGEPMVNIVDLPDGRSFSVTNRPTGDGGWVATHEDITQRRQAEKDLARTRNFLDVVVENVPEVLVVKDSEGRYVLVNRAGEEFYGRPREQTVGRTVFDFFPAHQARILMERDRQALETGGLTVENHPMDMPWRGQRYISSKRVAIPGADGKSEFLLSVLQDVTERKLTEQKIVHLAHHDPLTDLPNRAAFNLQLDSEIEKAAAAGERFALLCTDLDRFKEVNDVFGHAAGDSVLLEISQRLTQAAGDAFLSRLGGDEFTLIVTGTQPDIADIARRTAEQVMAAMSQDIAYEGRRLHPGISIGIAVYPDDGADAVTLLRNADAALYRAKADGSNLIRCYEADMDHHLHERRTLQSDLAGAIERNELLLHFQPQARLGGGVVGFEALVRWQHPMRGFVPPDTFIPLAEENAAIVRIGEWVLREACREAATWPHPLQIAVNLSPVQFRHDDLAGLVHGVLLESGLAPERLVLEITEGVLMDDYSHAVSVLRRLKALGVRIAMDDFGTGYSSLSYLQSFPFDKIKIDKTFISNVERNAQSAAIVRALLSLGRALELLIVAEGVENAAQLSILRHERCDEMQGYLIGRPAPISQYGELTGKKAATRTRVLQSAQ